MVKYQQIVFHCVLVTTKAVLILSLSGAFVATVGQTSPPISFLARRDFPVGQGARNVATGDFNSDGKLDLVTVTSTSNDISILLANGDGTFRPAVEYPVSANPALLQVGDFNGDGELDVFVASFSTNTLAVTQVSVLLGNGDGTFQMAKVTNVAGSNCQCITVGDFNSDGKLDLVFPTTVPQLNNSAMMVMLGNGDGTFNSPSLGNSGPFPTPLELKTVRVDGDGNDDLVASVSGSFLIFLGNGDGTFSSPTSVPDAGRGTGMIATDLNADGKLDLGIYDGSSIYVFLGNGNGTFQSALSTNVVGGVSVPPVVGDFNGDGKLDFLIPATGATAGTVLFGNGDGTFRNSGLPFSMPFGLPVPVAVGDFDGDGKLDVAGAFSSGPSGASGSSLATIAFGNGDGTFQFDAVLNTPGLQGIISGDFDGDGNIDLLGSGNMSRQYAFAVSLGNTGGTFTPPGQTNGTLISSGVCGDLSFALSNCPLAAGDLNLDGKLDFVATSLHGIGGTADVAVFIGNGDGSFEPEVDYSGGGNSVALGDFNGDGILDIVTCCDNAGDALILLGNGDGTFGFPSSVPVGTSGNFVVVGDFNHDGKLDLAVVADTSITILSGKGDGTFEAAVTYPVPQGSVSATVADFNRDGNLDIGIASSNSDSISVLIGNGDGTFRATSSISVVNSPIFLVSGDFNQDGKVDLAALIPGDFGSEVAVLAGNGDGSFQPAVYFGLQGVNFFVQGLSIADFNGDGGSDIAVAGTYLLLNTATGPAAKLAPSGLGFGNVAINVAAKQNIVLTNSGAKTLAISGITVTGAQSSDFVQNNTCSSSLAAGSSCDLTITFTPSTAGLRTASLQLADDAFNTPQMIILSGIGVASAPFVTLSPTTLTFGSQPTGTSSAAQVVTVSNTGNFILTLSSIAVIGSESTEFPETTTCANSLPAGAKCTVSIMFAPVAVGSRQSTLSISDNASGTPQKVALAGTAVSPSLGLGVAPGQSSSATVGAGNAATYILSVGGVGIGGLVNLSCSGEPKGARCSLPGNVTASATSASTFIVTITTTSDTMSAIPRSFSNPWLWVVTLMASALWGVPRAKRQSISTYLRILPSVLLIVVCSCGAGNRAGSQLNPNGTPVGTYTLTVTATSGSAVQSVPLTLVVK